MMVAVMRYEWARRNGIFYTAMGRDYCTSHSLLLKERKGVLSCPQPGCPLHVEARAG